MARTLEGDLNGEGLSFAIVVARFNGIVTGYLLRSLQDLHAVMSCQAQQAEQAKDLH